MNNTEQKVLVVPRMTLFPDGNWEGFRFVENLIEVFQVIERFGEYRLRGEMEKNPSWKQIIPQVLLAVGGKIFIHRILDSGGESRLHGRWPIFLGGHIDKGDTDIEVATQREFQEEIDYLGSITKRELVGVLNTEKTEVERVHFGLVWVYWGVGEGFRLTSDNGVADGRFVTWEEAEEIKEKMTPWSQEAFPVLKARYGRVRILPK